MTYILVNICLAGIFIFQLRYNNNRLSFGSIYYVYWWFFCSIGYLVYHDLYHFTFSPFLWIASTIVAVQFGQAIGRCVRIRSGITSTEKTWRIDERKIRTIICAVMFIELLIRIISISRRGQISLLFSVRGWLNILNSSEINRASGLSNGESGIISQIIGSIYYSTVILYGYTYDLKEIKKSWALKCLALLNTIFGVILSGGKFAIITFIVLFASGILTAKMRDDKLRFNQINYKKLTIYIAAVIGVLYLLMNNRAGKSVGLTGILAYGFGEIPSFNNWFVRGNHERTFGIQCFYGVVSHLFKSISFAEGYSNYPLSNAYPYVNIYTAFRGVISDFGHIGGLFVMLFVGISAGISHRKLRSSGFSNGIMAMLIGFLLLSFLIPLGYYLSLFLGYILYSMFMVFNYTADTNSD